MGYSINVSYHGQHLFTTDENNTATNYREAARLYGLLLKKFPESEGYLVEIREVTHVYCDRTSEFKKTL